MSLADALQNCPKCGSSKLERRGPTHLACPDCAFEFYLNSASAVVAFLEDDQGRVLFIRRAKEPEKGKLAFPGGFVDLRERVEDALAREVREEVGLELQSLNFLCSFPNQYHYKGVVYDTIDLFFTCRAAGLEGAQALDEVESVAFLDPVRVDLKDVAFNSQREGLKVYLETRQANKL